MLAVKSCPTMFFHYLFFPNEKKSERKEVISQVWYHKWTRWIAQLQGALFISQSEWHPQELCSIQPAHLSLRPPVFQCSKPRGAPLTLFFLSQGLPAGITPLGPCTSFIHISVFPEASTHLAAHTESLEGVQPQPATATTVSEAVHELCVQISLDLREPHQNHILFLGR